VTRQWRPTASSAPRATIDETWRRFCDAIARPDLAHDVRFATLVARKRNEDALEELVTGWTATREAHAAAEHLQAAGVPAFVAATNRDLAEDPHLAARGFPVQLEHPTVGALMHLGVPWRMSASDSRVRRAAPLLGQDTDQVLREVCGYSPDEIARLRTAAVLA
jgi:crotonobetainyl-CoA:carnitine CoA-transferase CaiB-like acyl-CoA transferase